MTVNVDGIVHLFIVLVPLEKKKRREELVRDFKMLSACET